jgi:hypothetical protein
MAVNGLYIRTFAGGAEYTLSCFPALQIWMHSTLPISHSAVAGSQRWIKVHPCNSQLVIEFFFMHQYVSMIFSIRRKCKRTEDVSRLKMKKLRSSDVQAFGCPCAGCTLILPDEPGTYPAARYRIKTEIVIFFRSYIGGTRLLSSSYAFA